MEKQQVDDLQNTERIDDQHDDEPGPLIVAAGFPQRDSLPGKFPDDQYGQQYNPVPGDSVLVMRTNYMVHALILAPNLGMNIHIPIDDISFIDILRLWVNTYPASCPR